MKKIYALILAIVMIISLFGCANGNDPVGETDNTVTTEATLGDHKHDHGNETIGATEGTENTTKATEDTKTPSETETIPDSPDDIGNGGVEDKPSKDTPKPTQPAPTKPAENKHEHSYTSKVTSPTCESKGYTTYTCSCGNSYKSDYKDATGHNYKTETVAPTTEAKGYDIHTCSKCGKSYKDNYTDKLPAPTEPAPTEPAECTNHEASADVLASVTVSGNWYNARCHCDYGTLYTADTREGAIALVHAHIAEHGGKSETHYVVCVIGFEQYDYPAFFDCIHCGETCIYTDYYNWKECISEEYFDYATAP